MTAEHRTPRPTSARFVVAAITGTVVAGGVAAALSSLLHALWWVTTGSLHGWNPDGPPLPAWRLAVFPAAGAVVCALAWWAVRRPGPLTGVAAGMDDPQRSFPLGRSLADAVVQVVNVALGASIGREAAPRLAAAAILDHVSRALRLDADQRRTVIGGAAAAALAGIYNAPLAGAAYGFEVLKVTRLGRAWPVRVGSGLLVALMCAGATMVAWPVIGRGAQFNVPEEPARWPLFPLAVGLGLLGGLVGTGFQRLAAYATRHRPTTGWRLVAALALVGLLTGCLAVVFPPITGNGQGIVRQALAGAEPLWFLMALFALKPLLTSLTLGAGADGGQLQPSMATGAPLGAAIALGLSAWPGLALPAWQFAVVTGVAVLAANQRAPVFAICFGLELTHPHPTLVVPAALAAAVVVAVRIGFDRAVTARGPRAPR
ncbi:hypothetical protein GCM10027418_26360 [Mariniluteicoccus endophyticus]